MKEFLSRAGVEFVVRNVDEDLEAYHELLARGFRAVPVTFAGAAAVKGYDPEALRRALQHLRGADHREPGAS